MVQGWYNIQFFPDLSNWVKNLYLGPQPLLLILNKIWCVLKGDYMDTEEIKFKFPRGFELAIHLTKEEFEYHIRLMAALKMFELGKISSGKAGELAEMTRTEFLEICGRYKVSVFNYPAEELENELKEDLETLTKLSNQ